METGRAIRCIEAQAPRMGFGWTLAAAGDVDGDGRGDLAIGSMRWTWAYPAAPSSVTVVSGADGRVLHEWPADAEEFWYGWYSFGAGPVACSVGDWNGDGRADVAVGGAQHAECRGRVDVYSGADGSAIRSFTGPEAHSGLGVSLCVLEDLDGDSKRELVVGMVRGADSGCDGANQRGLGSVRVYSSRDGGILAELRPETPSPVFGLSVASAGDADGDGRADLWVGEPLANFYAKPLVSPGLQLWSSREWNALRRVESSAKADGYADRGFASVLVPVDDVLVATIPDSFGGDVCVISRKGKILRRFSASATGIDPESLGVHGVGISACAVGDVDGDGSREVVLSGTTWRGCLTGVAVVVSPKKGTSLRTLTRSSIEPTPAVPSGK